MADNIHGSAGTFEDYPRTRVEYITAMARFYLDELIRDVTWRVRLDTSTNWAIISVMGILTFAFGSREHSHLGIVLGILFVLQFLLLEAKRYRFFDVWRQRVRMIVALEADEQLRNDLCDRAARVGFQGGAAPGGFRRHRHLTVCAGAGALVRAPDRRGFCSASCCSHPVPAASM